MPIPGVEQPEIVVLEENIRLKRYDGHWEKALAGYQDPFVYQNSEGIFDESRKPDSDYVRGMCQYLDRAGELYFIEVLENGEYIPVGDITVKEENPPIAIWYQRYRGKGIAALAMQAVIRRLEELGYPKIKGSEVYKWNEASLRLHKKLGFQVAGETEKSYWMERELRPVVDRQGLLNLKNIGKEMADKLLSIGVGSPESLGALGPRQAFARLKQAFPQVCLVHLYALEGAVQNREIGELSEEAKKELKAFSDSLKSGGTGPCA